MYIITPSSFNYSLGKGRFCAIGEPDGIAEVELLTNGKHENVCRFRCYEI